MQNLCALKNVVGLSLSLVFVAACNVNEQPAAPNNTASKPTNPSLQKSGNCVEPPSGLVSWWPGDGDVIDIVGGHHGTLQNGATFAPGMVGQAFSFDGVDDYISVPDVSSLRAIGAITIDFWANFDKVPRTGRLEDGMAIIEKADDYLLYWRSDANGLEFDITDACDRLYHLGVFLPMPALQAGEFHHFSVTAVDGGTAGPEFHVYIDGIEQPAVPAVDPPHRGCGWFTGVTGEFRIASRTIPNAEGAFDGIIDEIEIFNRALSASEIQAIYNAGSAGKCKKVTICHKPGTPAQKTMVIPIEALAGHLGHGDTIGPCQ